MSWSTNKTALIAGLPSGYRRIPQNKEPEETLESHNHKAYSLKLKALADVEMHTSNKISFGHSLKMRIIYRGVDGSLLDTNESLFITLIKTISTLTDFKNFNTEPTLEDLDEQHLLGELDFQFGIDTNC